MDMLISATPLSGASAERLLLKLVPGQALVYHVGYLPRDRERGPFFQQIHGLGTAMYNAHERGEVTLVQHKLKPFQYEYIAIKRDRTARKDNSRG